MTDRSDPGGGGLTGATGDLTPDSVDEPFVPAERREQAGEHGRGSVTYRQGASAAAQQGDVGEPGAQGPDQGSLNREAGYGSKHGLSPTDPAYRMEVEPPAEAAADAPPRDGDRTREPRQGVDDVTDREERF